MKTLSFQSVVLIACALLCACSKSNPTNRASTKVEPAATNAKANTLVVAREQGANSLDIQGIGTNRPAYEISWNIYDRLLTFGSKVSPEGVAMYDFQNLQGELAESWEIGADSITFRLRKDATFHDGSPVTAEDVKWSFERALAVGGFPTFQMKAGSIEGPEQFEVVDPNTFRLKLVRKDKLTLPDLAVPVAAIYNSKLAKQHATKDDPWALEWLKNNDAGSGAYKVERFVPGVELALTRFDAWKGGPLPKLDQVIVRVVPSASTRRALLERGDLDVSFDLPPRDFADLTKSDRVKVQGVPVENFMWFIDMNVKVPPFDDVEVRRAIAAAVPYDAIFKSTAYGRGKKLYGAASSKPETIDWPQPYPYATDIEAAKKHLAASAHAKGFSTKLYYNLGQSTWSEPIALLVQESLRPLGIEVTLEKVPAANWRAEMGKKTMPLLINDMGGWLNYPDYFFFWNYHGQNAVFNTMSYQNADMDRFIDQARFADDPASYEQSVKSFLAKAFEDVPRIPLYQANLDVAMQPNVVGYHYWFHRQIDYRQMSRN